MIAEEKYRGENIPDRIKVTKEEEGGNKKITIQENGVDIITIKSQKTQNTFLVSGKHWAKWEEYEQPFFHEMVNRYKESKEKNIVEEEVRKRCTWEIPMEPQKQDNTSYREGIEEKHQDRQTKETEITSHSDDGKDMMIRKLKEEIENMKKAEINAIKLSQEEDKREKIELMKKINKLEEKLKKKEDEKMQRQEISKAKEAVFADTIKLLTNEFQERLGSYNGMIKQTERERDLYKQTQLQMTADKEEFIKTIQNLEERNEILENKIKVREVDQKELFPKKEQKELNEANKKIKEEAIKLKEEPTKVTAEYKNAEEISTKLEETNKELNEMIVNLKEENTKMKMKIKGLEEQVAIASDQLQEWFGDGEHGKMLKKADKQNRKPAEKGTIREQSDNQLSKQQTNYQDIRSKKSHNNRSADEQKDKQEMQQVEIGQQVRDIRISSGKTTNSQKDDKGKISFERQNKTIKDDQNIGNVTSSENNVRQTGEKARDRKETNNTDENEKKEEKIKETRKGIKHNLQQVRGEHGETLSAINHTAVISTATNDAIIAI